ncbi:hypothetical protein MCOR34_004708 [Pyricularia oryzae]|uniref:Dynamin family protein n=1 Tax=Pyricularia oryzae TaxID=318829 RepID=A0A4P7N846_PYROR|nr:hypothetical protein MCOR34_004708 [Pyricularia oryzae]KAI6457978.1 hypothetical protein MCOR17_007590 [Pyricularia oryzae]KAI6567129.1 hypothetical protein MCOR04_008671 [Pyricularia oryzae]QBZ58643.1 hypothetical protein PoMZ_03600 [Pyricularia oryzae]
MPRVIKQEPQRSRETPASPCAGRTPVRVNRTPTMTSRASEDVNLNTTARRNARSLAPSADTRQAQAMAALQDDSDSDPDLVVIREMRQVVKPDPDRHRAVPGRGLGVNVDSDSLLNRNFERIAKNLKALGETLGELQTLGIQHVDLPSLVLVGDQSSGKSTLMSGIAGISLPHREGMCTRCPVHIRLSKSDSWALQISLQQDYTYVGTNSVASDDFGPWSPQPRVVKEFWSCREKDDDRIRNAIRWAQVAILNHHKPHRLYVPRAQQPDDEARLQEEEKSAETDFSPNVVALQISGPNLPDISFYDLPGLIKATRREEDHYLVKVVENMARKYIADPNAIIMWAVPMNSDPENSSTLAIIRKEAAQNRTVGVLTKADLLPPGNHEQWLGMLAGTQHSVGYKFFITARQPTDPESQNSFEEAFFNGQAPDGVNPWSDRFQQHGDRCGLNQLVVFLSDTLNRAFYQSLPGILETISDRLRYVNGELAKLPDTPDHPYAELREALIGFVNGVRNGLGLTVTGDFDADCKSLLDAFERKILELKPRYIVKSPAPSRRPMTPQARRIGPAPTPTPSRTATSQSSIDLTLDDDTPVPPSRRRRLDTFLEGQQPTNGTPKRSRPTVKQEESFRVAVATPPLSPVKNDLATVRRRCQARARDGEPDVTPPEIYPELSLEAISRWARPLDDCVDSFIQLLSRKLDQVLEMSFEKLRTKAAFREAKNHLAAYVQQQKEELSQSLSTLFSRESKRLYTRNTEAFERHKQAEREILLHRRYECRWREHQEGLGKDAPPIKDHDKLTAQEKKDKANNLQLLGPDEYARELEICAHVRGYYLTAAKRFIDCVGQAIVSDLIPSMVTTLSRSHLDEKLGLAGPQAISPERIDALMAEEHHVAAQRKKHQDEQQKLQKAMESITKLESAGDGEDDHSADASSEATNAATSFASRNNNGLGASQSAPRYQPYADDGMDVDHSGGVA